MRILTRAVSALLALALLAGGVLVALEILVAGLGREKPLVLPWDDWRRTALDTPWRDADARLAFILMIVIGALLLLLLVARRRPTTVALEHRVDGSDAELDRAGLERWLTARLEQVDGVSGARVRVRGGKAKVRAETPARETVALQESLRSTAAGHLDELGLARPLPLRVAVASRRSE